MSWVELLALAVAGFGAGMINTIVGSGTLITFPILLFLGMRRSRPTSRARWA
ncbi:hypothetical protein [Ornithinimicrobium sp. INDO-MA30-4]|uniref:hypothetical protein n=1 Tax=Ornithinimicrobium sp. INDO-MA30-4 TaxID=2908651 RepID=UPI0028833280|nr:hypothetical protein [Ornithinimicrobium sp. INDO-MA30-4]